jgi:hypothetical protein
MENNKITIPAGTILYRAADDICEYSKGLIKVKKKCTDTGKIGVYLSTYLLQALAMAIEYNRDLQLGVFKTLKDISVTPGKYSFRNIHPERYYNNDGELILHVNTLKNEMISHINQTYPILSPLRNNNEKEWLRYNSPLKENEGEIFLTDDEYLNNIELIETYNIDLSRLKTHLDLILNDLGYLPLTESEIYLESYALTPISCKVRNKQQTRKLRRKLKSKSKKRLYKH